MSTGKHWNARMADRFQDILIFEIAGQRLGLFGGTVRELLRAASISRVPDGRRLVEGVINVRGEILPVLDMRHWLGLPAKAVAPSDVLLVVRVGDRLLALRADCAQELVRVEVGLIENIDYFSQAHARVQMAKMVSGIVIIPDLAHLLSLAPSAFRDETLATL
jgi:purine-binding chemotaxis protein CheW